MTRGWPLLLFLVAGCKDVVQPELRCTEKCSAVASRCSARECSRGCGFIIDRIVEREDDSVIVCMSKGTGKCDDPAWAECASKVGIHADGGPGAPEPIPQYQEEKKKEEEEE